MSAKKNPIANWLACVALFVALVSGCTPPGPRALLRGKQLVDEGRFPEAIESLKAATSLLNTNAQAWNYFGLAYHGARDFTNAAQAYGQALKLDRDLIEAHFNLGSLWLEQNRFDLAKTEFAAFTLRRPTVIEGWLKLASAQLRSRELLAAEKSFNEALRLDRKNAEALNGLGLIQVQRNRPRDAAQFFSAALKEQPNYAPALLNLAVVSQSAFNDRTFALKKYREYLALSPRPANWDAVNAAASALEQELNHASRPAPAPVAAATQAAPNPVVVKTSAPPVVRASAPVRTEPVSNSARATSQPTSPTTVETVKVQPAQEARVAQDANGDAVSATGITQSESSPPPKRGFLQKINPLNLFRHSPTNTKPLSTAESEAPSPESSPASTENASGGMARYKYRNPARPAPGDRAAAEKLFASALREHKSLHYPEAVQLYRKAIEADPSYFEAYHNLAIAALAARNVSASLSAGETALAIRPESLDTRLNFAQSLRQAGYPFDSANELAIVLSKNSNDARVHLALGNIYAQEFHQPDKARQHYLKVLDLDPQNPQAGAIRDWIVANPSR